MNQHSPFSATERPAPTTLAFVGVGIALGPLCFGFGVVTGGVALVLIIQAIGCNGRGDYATARRLVAWSGAILGLHMLASVAAIVTWVARA
jgi:hypothetical protein